jgi:hypothetical protein
MFSFFHLFYFCIDMLANFYSDDDEPMLEIPAAPVSVPAGRRRRVTAPAPIIVKRPVGRPRIIIDLGQQLFDHCPQDVRTAALNFLRLQNENGLSLAALRKVFDLVRELLPVGHKLPTFSLARKALVDDAIPAARIIHCCVNDCCVYDDLIHLNLLYASLSYCPACNEPRYNERFEPRKVKSG